MKIKDLIVKLSLIEDKDKEVYLDLTRKDSTMFVFGRVVDVEEITTALDEEMILITSTNYDNQDNTNNIDCN